MEGPTGASPSAGAARRSEAAAAGGYRWGRRGRAGQLLPRHHALAASTVDLHQRMSGGFIHAAKTRASPGRQQSTGTFVAGIAPVEGTPCRQVQGGDLTTRLRRRRACVQHKANHRVSAPVISTRQGQKLRDLRPMPRNRHCAAAHVCSPARTRASSRRIAPKLNIQGFFAGALGRTPPVLRTATLSRLPGAVQPSSSSHELYDHTGLPK